MSAAMPNKITRHSRSFHPASKPSNSAPGNSACSRSNSAITSSVRGTQPNTTFCDLAPRGSDTLVG